MAKEKWTAREEAELTRLTQRKAQVMTVNKAPLAELLRMMPALSDEGFPAPQHIDWFVGYAEQLRDVLEPFDSGVRASPAPEFTPERPVLR